MTYAQIFEWVTEHFDMNNYFSVEDLLYDVKNEFNRTRAYFPIEAEDLLREQFQYREQYAQLKEREEEIRDVQEILTGSREIPVPFQDQVIEELNRPEIMGIDMTQFRTDKEYVTPPIVQRFARVSGVGTLGRLVSRARSFFGRLLGR